MDENEFPVLKITNITWDKDHDEFEKLPKEVELNWGTKTWNIDEVSNWLSINLIGFLIVLILIKLVLGNIVGVVAALADVVVVEFVLLINSEPHICGVFCFWDDR